MIEGPIKANINLKYAEDEIELAIQRNDERIVSYLVEQLMPNFAYLAKKWSVSVEDAQDNYYNTWETVIEYIRSGKYRKENFVGLFKNISRYKFLNGTRNRKSIVTIIGELLPDDCNFEMFSNENEEELLSMVAGCCEKLDDKCQELLQLFYSKGLPIKQIGNMIGTSENNARQKKFQCITKLRSCVNKLIDRKDG